MEVFPCASPRGGPQLMTDDGNHTSDFMEACVGFATGFAPPSRNSTGLICLFDTDVTKHFGLANAALVVILDGHDSVNRDMTSGERDRSIAFASRHASYLSC